MPTPTTAPGRGDDSDSPRSLTQSGCGRSPATREVLDLNSSYAYLLWCRDFGRPPSVAEHDGRVGGFVTGFVRPEDPRRVFVWQVAVDEALRGRGVAAAMLNDLLDRLAPQGVTHARDDDQSRQRPASIALFTVGGASVRYAGDHQARTVHP